MFTFFSVSGLDIMGKLDEITIETKKEICNYVYKCQTEMKGIILKIIIKILRFRKIRRV